MNISGQTKIYRKDFNGRPAYSRRISSQEYKDGQKGEWLNLYENGQMPKGTNIADGSIIEVTAGFEAVFRSKGELKRKLVVTGWRLLDAPRQEYDVTEQEYNYWKQDEETPF